MEGFTLLHVFMQLDLCNYNEVFPKFKKENYRKDLEKNQDFGGSKYV
jgi:hypothetical protein